MRHLLRQPRFFLLASCLLISLLLLTLPISYAVWREVLGVAAEVDTTSEPTSTVQFSPTPSVITATPTVTPLDAAIITLLPDTVVPSPQINDPVTTSVIPTNVPTMDVPPTVSQPTEPPSPGPLLPTEEPADTEAPLTELPTELPSEASTPGG